MKGQVAVGTIRHRRFTDKPHEFCTKVFMMHLDLDNIKSVFNDYWFWSYEKPNIAAFNSRQYLHKRDGCIKQTSCDLVENIAGVKVDQVFLLTNLTYFGYCFNPISVFFCFCDNKIKAVILEVTNTPWGERHHYVLTTKELKKNLYAAEFKKKLHVSPFLSLDYQYQIRFKHTPEKIILHIRNMRGKDCHFDATLNLSLKPINRHNLASALIRFPFMTTKVIAYIYWQALRLFLKRVKIYKHRARH